MNSMFPNPTNSAITLNIESKTEHDMQMEILDVTGKIHITHASAIFEGYNNVRIDVSSLTEGIYFIRMTDNNGEVQNHKFIKIN